MKAVEKSYTIQKRDGTLHGPYSLAMLKKFIGEGRFGAYDFLLGAKTLPLQAVEELKEISFSESHSVNENRAESSPPPNNVPSQRTLPKKPSLLFEYPLDEFASLSPDELADLLGKKEDTGERQIFFKGQLLSPDARPSYGGSLKEHNLIRILTRLLIGKETGRLQLREEKETIELFLEEGRLVYATSTVETTRLGEMVVQAGFMNRSGMSQVLKESFAKKRPLGLYLLEKKYLNPLQIQLVFTEQLQERLRIAFQWYSGTYQFFSQQRTGHSFPTSFHPFQTMVESVFHRIPSLFISSQMTPHLQKRVARLKHPQLLFTSFPLEKNHYEMIALVQNKSSLQEVLLEIQEKKIANEDTTFRLFYFLWQVDLIGFREEMIGKKTQDLLQKLEEQESQYRRKSAYECLGLAPHATAKEMRDAYLRFAKKYHPDQQPLGTHPLVLKKMEGILACISEAYQKIQPKR